MKGPIRTPSFPQSCAALLLWGAFVGACAADETAYGPTGQGAGGAGGGTVTTTGGATTTTSSVTDTVDDDGDGYSEALGDCNDGDPAVYPGTTELCDDGIDNNCNGALDTAEPDGDGDGFGPCMGDCDDENVEVGPASPEVGGDGIDNDCDGTIDGDFDGDGFTIDDGDCDDGDADVFPGAPELCWDGTDNDCDSYADALEPDGDADGWGPCAGDCNDVSPLVNPGVDELPGNGIDDNCDNLIDDDVDGDGWTEDNGDCNDGNPEVNPSVFEACSNLTDDDCDGITDVDCVTPCDIAAITRSSVGCIYYAVDANNDPIEGYDSQPYAVAVSNTDANASANVQVQVRVGGVWQMQQSAVVAPSTLRTFDLPDRHVNYTGSYAAGAYRVVSDLPVIAYQFQPINGQTSYTSDASLLLPDIALDRYYYVAGWGEPSYGNSQLMIVGTEDGTTVTITPSQATQAGGSIPALASGVAYQFPTALNDGDFIQLEGPSASFTGSYIEADKPIAVFSTNWCANIPALGCCCDHLEEQMIGLQTWGTTYVAARMPVRSTGTPEATYWHVLASQPDTQVSFIANGAVTGLPGSPQTLQPGQALTLGVSGSAAVPGDFVVQADKPILVMEYLTSSYTTNVGATQAGDPAMTQAVPVEQFLDHYLVLVPGAWSYDYLILTKPVGATVSVDGTPVPQASFLAISNGVDPVEWEVARIAVGDGVHALDGSAPFGVVVVGYDAYDSYAYPGGLDQQLINPIN